MQVAPAWVFWYPCLWQYLSTDPTAGGGTVADGTTGVVPRWRLRSAARSFCALEICFAKAAGSDEAVGAETVDRAFEYPRETLVAT